MGPSVKADHANSTRTKDASAKEDAPPSRRPSFLARLSLPLRARGAPRNLAEFYIKPKDPHRRYNAGDHVQGAVVLVLLKPIRITHLTVALHGYVRVYKTPNAAAAAAANDVVNPAEVPGSMSGSSRFRYLGNGHASLFQDEQVLSADGKLEPGKYEFNFDLMFPSEGLPSSIDFERGTISYMVTATLTRPTSISPMTSCEKKVCFVEHVDIGKLAHPRARTISLDPLPRRAKRKMQVKMDKGGTGMASTEVGEAASDLDSSSASVQGDTNGQNGQNGQDTSSHVHPCSPVHSEVRSISGDSMVSGSTGRGGDRDPAHSGNTAGSHVSVSRQSMTTEEKTITATIELQKGGCLPGDMVPVKVLVQHNKAIKSMHGVIVTLYRHGRIDTAPPPSLFKGLTAEEAKKLEKEEYYPKSRTGLGGLSLSSTGSCSVFRKDLSQAFSPLIIDPTTLSANITTSVRLPVDVFPTIKGVPGEMITFKYQLEVIVDLGGKLANQIHGTNQNSPPGGAMASAFNGTGGEANSSMASWYGNSMVNTDPLRREKGVITVVLEVLVGTTDSSRLRGRVASRVPSVSVPRLREDDASQTNGEVSDTWPNATEDGPHGFNGYGALGYAEQDPLYDEAEPLHPYSYSYSYWNHTPTADAASAPVYMQPPTLPDERGLSEKERIRRAEQRLLPSRPRPDTAHAGPSSSPGSGENIYDAEDDAHAAPMPTPTADEMPSAPTLEDLGPANPRGGATDDKQELERQRLLVEASAPPEFPEDYDAGASGAAARLGDMTPTMASAFQPSAPVLTEEDEYSPSAPLLALRAPAEPLPRYER